MTTSGQDEPRQQNFYGSGPSFGGDNKGTINNVLLDPRTRAMLEKMSEKAPELAALLKKALSDGFISPDVAEALMYAARNINYDVAEALMIAGQNINHEVADALMFAGQNINEEVADRFVRVKEELNSTASELDRVLSSLHEAVGQVNSLQGRSDPDYQFGPAGTVTGTARRTGGVITLPSPQRPDKWWFRFRLTCCSFGVGVIAGAILMHYHLVAYVALAGVLGFAALVIPRVANARRGRGLP